VSRGSTEAKGLKLTGHIDPGLSVITSNRLKLKQVAYNLLSNAIKYTSSGEVSLTMTAVAAGQWQLRVADTGVGIGADDQERVFEEFERAASDDIPGTGLGLAIVKELSRALKGELHFQSFKGSGSVFEVVFPVTLEVDGEANPPDPSGRAA
jgi:signal transduction histidine kinase